MYVVEHLVRKTLELVSAISYRFTYLRGLPHLIPAMRCRVARWYIFKPKIPIWVHFESPWTGKVWLILWPFGI
jgi:hypothetical protein